MLSLLHRSKSLRGGSGYRNASSTSPAVNTATATMATANTATMATMTTATTSPASVSSLAPSSSTSTASFSPASSAGTTDANTSSKANVHLGGQAKTHGPNAPLSLSLLSTMVVPSAGPSVVLSTDSSASGVATLSFSLPVTSVSHSSSNSSSQSSDSTSKSSCDSSHSLVSSSSPAASVTAARSFPHLPSVHSSASQSSATTSKQPGANSTTSLNSKPTPATPKLLSLFPSSQAAAPSKSSPTESNFVSKPVLQTSTVLGLVESKPSPPSPGINGKRECPYVNRPLPPPPPPKNSATMPSSGRPSTSGGRRAPSSTEMSTLAPLSKPTPINHRISRDDSFLTSQPRRAATFDTKRMSRDDMFLGSHQAAARKAAFHVPLRSQTIGEGPDLRESPPPSFPKRVYRSESLASGEIQIGMALGSPAHPPSSEQIQMFQQQHMQNRQYQPQEELYNQREQLYAQAPRQHTPPGHDNHIPSQAQEEAPAPAPAPTLVPTLASKPTSPPNPSMQRSKSTRRKIFGFFGSKKQETKPPMPAPPLPRALTEAMDNSSDAVSQSSTSTPTMERSTTRGANRKYQPIVIPGEPEPAASTSTTVLEAPAPQSTGLKSSPSFRSKRPFLRAKASEPAIRKRPDISNPIPGTLANSSVSSLTSMKAVPINPTIVHPPAADAPSHHQPHHTQRHMLAASPYLNVDIPESSMERYSIMFGGLLQTGPSASSLLARRQATLDKLKTINDKMHHDDLERNHANALASDAYLQVGGLQRRATSPHARSPSFSLFPSKSPMVSHNQNLLNVGSGPRSPRLRSNTSPAATLSPMQAEFNFSTQTSRTTLRENPTGIARKVPAVSHMGLAMTTMPSPASAMAARSVIYFDPDQSSLIIDSPTEMSPRVDDRKTWKETTQELPVFKPVIQEPQWQMVSPPSAGSNSSHNSNNSQGRNMETNTSNSSSPATEMSIELQVDEPDSALKSAVEISIARQISVSRQQREMLRPLKTSNLKGMSPVSGSPALSRSATLKLGRNEWLQETKSSTPTLVVPPEQDANYSYHSNNETRSRSNTAPQRPDREHNDQQSVHYLSPRSNTPAYQLAQNRKSERVILEAA